MNENKSNIDNLLSLLEPDYESIQSIRNKLTDTILVYSAILGAPLIFIALLRYLKIGGFYLFVTHLLIFLVCALSAFFRKHLSLKTKTFVFIGGPFLIATTSIFKWGLIGMGIPFLIFCSVLVTIFFGIRNGIFITIINLVILAIAGTLFYMGFLHYNFDVSAYSLTLSSWISACGGYGIFTLILVLSLGRLHSSMDSSIKKLASRTLELSQAKEQMEKEIQNRKQAEMNLQESEEQFRIVLENLPGCVFVHNLEGNFLIVNDEACLTTGYSREELFNKTVEDTETTSFKMADGIPLWQQLVKTGESVTFESETRRKDGSVYDTEIHLKSIMLQRGPVILVTSFDISERKKFEGNLARRSELERLISKISSRIVGMNHYEIEAHIDEALASIGKKTGVDHAYLFLFRPDRWKVDSINEWRLDDTVPPIETLHNLIPERGFPWFTEQMLSQDVVHIPDINKLPPEAQDEKVHFKKHGIKSLIVLVIRQGENLLGFLGFDNVYEKRTWSEDEIIILRIIGEAFTSAIKRKQIEEEQEMLQVQLSTAVDLAHLGPWEFDIEKDEFTFNDHFYKTYHTTAKEMGGYTMTPEEYTSRFFHPDDIEVIGEKFKKSLEPGAPPFSRVEHRMFYADGTMGYAMAQISISRNSKGEPVKAYGVNQDITEWKVAQKKLLESEEKLARSKKMESLGLLAGGVAHDLNNVLSGIVSYPELLLFDLPEGSSLRKPIETIKESGDKAVAIVQDLLTIARGAATTREPMKLNDLIDEYLTSPEFINLKNHHSGVNVKEALEDDLFNINGSLIHIKKIIMNLVSNAFEAIEDSGTVTIVTSNCYIDKPISKYEDVNIGEYVVLSVTDDGPGIPPENLGRIFDPFFTKKVMGVSGTGLGLTVVWNTVQDHSGYIDVKSDNSGTIFDLYFPITRDETTIKTSSVPLAQIKGNGELILVVDDIESQREISCKMLEFLGYRHVAVSSGEEAIEYLKENKADLILLDMIMLPGISGRETYEQIVKINPEQKALILSGYSETGDVVATQKLGAGNYIKKPFNLESLGLGIKNEFRSKKHEKL